MIAWRLPREVLEHLDLQTIEPTGESYVNPSLREGLQTGLKMGREEGLEEGRQVGRQEGTKKGELIGRIRILEEMLGVAVSSAEDLSELDAAELQRSCAELKSTLENRN